MEKGLAHMVPPPAACGGDDVDCSAAWLGAFVWVVEHHLGAWLIDLLSQRYHGADRYYILFQAIVVLRQCAASNDEVLKYGQHERAV